METCQGQIHLTSLESTNLRSVESALIGELVLCPAALFAKLSNPGTQTPLKLPQLHQKQFGRTLLKDILLIRRVGVLRTEWA